MKLTIAFLQILPAGSLRECSISCDSFFVNRFSELAAELDMAIAITLLERHEPKPRNTVCLFDRHGNLQYRYSKVHICDFGEEDDEGVLDAGDAFFVADLDTKDGSIKVGSMICYDREFPESARILMLKGADSMIRLTDVTEDNWFEAATLSVKESQKGFLAPAIGILARGYVYRNCNANTEAIYLYEKHGFTDSGYIDEDAPDSVNMICRLF